MLLELLASTLVLWTGFDNYGKLTVTCAAVTLDVSLPAKATYESVSFWIKDDEYTWHYVVPMRLNAQGHIRLEPTAFWIEAVRQQKNLKLKVGKEIYDFDLTGTKNLINCDGVVVK